VLARLRKVLDGLAGVWGHRRSAQRHARLLSVIEGQILPRLVIATGSPSAPPGRATSGDRDPTSDDVLELARLLIAHDAMVASEYVQVLRGQGASVESLWMQLVAPTARYLNQLASSGTVDARSIAGAQQRLHALLHQLEVRRDSTHSLASAGELGQGA
jgi:hypothetical protein